MNKWIGIAFLTTAVACAGGKDDDTQDTDTDTGGETDTDVVYLDEDEDGFTSDIDCNDNDYQIYPGADEICDGIDNDCDNEIDEDFDADEDGYTSALACEDGQDCDDDDVSSYPGATEIPYDEIDQDCDGSDLNDVDEDGYIGLEAGGDDCDDSNPDVNPGAVEVAKDMIDNDCKDGDSFDGDGDGYDDQDYGGDDCDDTDANIFPGRIDWFNDEMDMNCDGADADEMDLGDALVSVVGDASLQDLLGFDALGCDLDGDGSEDLVISAPFSNSYGGRVGIFYGSNSDLWTADMSLTDADTVISGLSYSFFGMGILCSDFDGDGYQDLAVGSGEINYSPYVSDFEVILFYGDGSQWSAKVTESDGDAQIQRTLGVSAGVPSVLSTPLMAIDLDGDGSSELGMTIQSDYSTSGNTEVLFLAGGRYTGIQAIEKSAAWTFVDDDEDGDTSSVSSMMKVGDVDGNGVDDLIVNQIGFSSDPTATEPPTEGRVSMINIPAKGTHDLSDLEYGNALGTNDEALGSVIVADIDGDGVEDALFSGPRHDTGSGDERQGIVYFVSDLKGTVSAASSLVDLSLADLATSYLLGDGDQSLFGFTMEVADDLNGDGALEVLIREPFVIETTDGAGNAITTTEDIIWVLSGAELSTASSSALDINTVRIQEFEYELDGAETGNNLSSSDLDGDGAADILISAYAYPDSTTGYARGKVYVYLSDTWGW